MAEKSASKSSSASKSTSTGKSASSRKSASTSKSRSTRAAKAAAPAKSEAVPVVASGSGSYLEWGPVFGGATVALAISMLLTQFGAGVGLSAAEEATLESGGVSWNVLVAGIWVILVALASASAGGYLAGRMRSPAEDGTDDEVEFRDGVHGLVVWAVSGVFAMLAVSVMTALAGIGAALETDAASAEVAADVLRNAATAGVVFNFASSAGAALSAAGAWFAATAGGAHRNEGIVIHDIVPAYLRDRFKRA